MDLGTIGCLGGCVVALAILAAVFLPGAVHAVVRRHRERPARERRAAVAREVRRRVPRAREVEVSDHSIRITVDAGYEDRREIRRELKQHFQQTILIEGPAEEAIDASWERYSHAYGSAGDIPAWLAHMTPDGSEEVWGELWSRLCHQGTVYSASFAALEALASAAREWAPSDREPALTLAGAIVARRSQDEDSEAAAAEHQSTIAELAELTEETLRSPGQDAVAFIALLAAWAAFIDETGWSRQLELLMDEEFRVECPHCDTPLYVAIGRRGFFTAVGDYATKDEVTRAPLHPAASLTGLAGRLHEFATAAAQPAVATAIEHLFGEATCAACTRRFAVADAVLAAGDSV